MKLQAPCARVTTLGIFGIPKQPGLLHRPKLLGGQVSELIIARNAHVYTDPAKRPVRLNQGDGFLMHPTVYTGLGDVRKLVGLQRQQLATQLQVNSNSRRRIRYKQRVVQVPNKSLEDLAAEYTPVDASCGEEGFEPTENDNESENNM